MEGDVGSILLHNAQGRQEAKKFKNHCSRLLNGFKGFLISRYIVLCTFTLFWLVSDGKT